MQGKKQTHEDFLRRTDALAVNLGMNVSELVPKLKISRAMIFAYRSGNRPITSKAWMKLEAAEAAAGIVRIPPGIGDETTVREDPLPYRTSGLEPLRSPGEPTILERMETLQRGYDETRAALADANRKLDALMDLFTKMPKS